MTAARPRKKKGSKIWSPRTLALAAVFLLSLGIGTVGITASRESQLATALAPETCEAKNSECPQEVPKKTVYKCDWPQKITDKKDPDYGAQCVKGMVCTTQAAGKTISGKCKCPQVCKGNADEATDKNDPGKGKEEGKGDGKMPELPKLPEPPKGGDSPPGGQPSPGTCKEGDASGVNALGQPCPKKEDTRVGCLIDPTAFGCPDADTTKTEETTTSTTTDSESSKPFSWIAVVRTLAKGASDVATNAVNTVTNTVQNIGTTFNGNSTDGVRSTETVRYDEPRNSQGVPLSTAVDSGQRTFAQTTGFTVQGNTGTSGNLNENSQTNPGFWARTAEALRNFLGRF